ncbi:bifunctional 2-polyprenyl-6-hydroxyphenol methylase/3-demethylubiquinol 3-O-methyltransferase UbiG [Sulfobacillus sp. hq2]|uniref:class I SAM-dependent methyltransferase n=1 Tax=Sulfobacillus TaxID=28033 RepID=UPI001A9A4C56|nr:class I SAM-dependent methyltransferase [Sulfobacillus sp. hq2]
MDNVNTLSDLFKQLAESDTSQRLAINTVSFKTARWRLTKKSGIIVLPHQIEAILCVETNKIDLGEVDTTRSEMMEPFLLGAGEPYYKKAGIRLLIRAAKGDADVVIYMSWQPGEQIEQKAFQEAADSLDDYYFGYDQRYRRVYDAGAQLWESDQPNASLVNMLQKHFELAKGRIVDLGCGEGRDSLYLAQQGLEVTGVDISSVALGRARELAHQLRLQTVRFIESDVIYLRPIADSSYDVALNMGCLHMLTDTKQRSRHIQRVFEILKPGGYFLVDHCKSDWGKGFYSIPDYDAVAKDLIPGQVIPRRVRVDGQEVDIPLEVLPHLDQAPEVLIDEICSHGFDMVDTESSNTEAFGNSAVVLFRKPNL